MRLWHESLINYLPRQQLLGQHRECCALRGNGWNKPHKTVNYVFKHSPMNLFFYHQLVIKEMVLRGYRPDILWQDPLYRGMNCEPFKQIYQFEHCGIPIYEEHNELYLKECLDNLLEKGINLFEYVN